MALAEKLDQVVDRHNKLAEQMSTGAVLPEEYAKLSKEYADLTPIVGKAKEFNSLMDELEGANELLADPEIDGEMRSMAEEEVREIQEKLPGLTEIIQKLLLPKDVADTKNAILEIRAGTGGEEASLFAAVLFRMYEQYARQNGWGFEVMAVNETGLGGLKEAMATLTGIGAFARMKFESGVHRVQRVPTTESGGRIHTSAATVAVLPEAEDLDVDIEEKDLRIDTYRAQGAQAGVWDRCRAGSTSLWSGHGSRRNQMLRPILVYSSLSQRLITPPCRAVGSSIPISSTLWKSTASPLVGTTSYPHSGNTVPPAHFLPRCGGSVRYTKRVETRWLGTLLLSRSTYP